MKFRFAILASALLLGLAHAPAVFAAPTVNERIVEMEKRIDQGIASKELTRHEADKLREELREIRRKERRMEADGRLSPRERDILHADLDRLKRHIFREKHDEETRRR
jgi:septal ring factor EnvC (AmiA/AmiB activator)